MNKYCEFAGIGLIAWGPLNGGRLARPLAQDTTRSESAVGTVFAQKSAE
jgi:aryl-alcohol dehydrogenase-like predicted oxidoreductase